MTNSLNTTDGIYININGVWTEITDPSGISYITNTPDTTSPEFDNLMTFRNNWYRPEYTTITIVSGDNDQDFMNIVDNISETYFPDQPTLQVDPLNYLVRII